jgi:hypothetical protein
MRAELASISTGFDKLPTLFGNANKLVAVNSSGTALEVASVLPSLTITDTNLVVEDNADSTRKFRFEASGITAGATRVLTVPDANMTLVGADTVQTLTNKTITGTKETRVAVAASNLDLSLGNYFTCTISGATTLTVSNVPATGTAVSLILDLTNGGSATITWWSGMKWAGGAAPTLTAAGRDVLGFFTHDGGTTWTGLLLGKDVK